MNSMLLELIIMFALTYGYPDKYLLIKLKEVKQPMIPKHRTLDVARKLILSNGRGTDILSDNFYCKNLDYIQRQSVYEE